MRAAARGGFSNSSGSAAVARTARTARSTCRGQMVVQASVDPLLRRNLSARRSSPRPSPGTAPAAAGCAPHCPSAPQFQWTILANFTPSIDLKRPIKRERVFPFPRTFPRVWSLGGCTILPGPPHGRGHCKVRGMYSSICKCSKEECYVNASVNGVDASDVHLDIERVGGLPRTVEVANVLMIVLPMPQ